MILTCDPLELLLWSQSERGSICEKTETETWSNHSTAHPVSVSVLQQRQHHNGDILCFAVAENRRSRSGDAKSRGSLGGMETLINAKMGFVYFFHFPLSTDV